MRMLVSGAHGLIGSRLVSSSRAGGHEVCRLTRGAGAGDAVHWDPARRTLAAGDVDGFDAVIHLAGESIAAGRWTERRMRAIRDSRLRGTELLVEALVAATQPPRVLLVASAIGAYGDRGDEVLTEDSEFGSGFLAELCRDWEQATEPAAAAGIRVVNLRFGVVLARYGGALPRMLLPFRLGLGGRLGSGDQYFSWIALDDVEAIVRRALADEAVRGPINTVAPQPVTNRELTAAIADTLGRAPFLPLPGWIARLAFGRIADEALLASQRVMPARLAALGFEFRWPELRPLLAELVRR